MKKMILALSFIALSTIVNANEIASQSTWIDTKTVLISNSQNPDIARRDCEISMRIINLMSNERIVFSPSCTISHNPRCNYYYCYELSNKALVVDQKPLE